MKLKMLKSQSAKTIGRRTGNHCCTIYKLPKISLDAIFGEVSRCLSLSTSFQRKWKRRWRRHLDLFRNPRFLLDFMLSFICSILFFVSLFFVVVFFFCYFVLFVFLFFLSLLAPASFNFVGSEIPLPLSFPCLPGEKCDWWLGSPLTCVKRLWASPRFWSEAHTRPLAGNRVGREFD